MPKPIKVLSYMDATYVTGPAKGLLEFAASAREAGDGLPAVEFTVVTPHRGPGQPDNPFVDAAKAAGIPVDVIYETGPYDLRLIPQLQQIVEARNPDIVQTHNVKPHFIMRLSRLHRRYCWVAIHHGYVTTDWLIRCYNQLDRWSYQAPRSVVSICGAFAEDLVRKGIPRDRITVVRNSIRPFPPMTSEALVKVAELRERLPAGVPVLLAIGRLSLEKGHVDLIRALGKVQVPFHLVLVGDGPERSRIISTIQENHLIHQVTLEGLQLDVRPYYEIADVVVLPSHSEGVAHVLLEAMMAEKLVVATRVGGIPEIATHEDTALLVEPRNPESLAAGIERALTDPPVGMAARAKAKALTCSPQARRRELIRVYQKALAGNSGVKVSDTN